MRRRTRAWLCASAATGALTLATLSSASSDNLLTNGGFEDGTTGWAPAVGATLAVDASTTPAEGSAAAHLTSTRAGLVSLASQYWLVDVDPTPGGPSLLYTVAAQVLDDDDAISDVTLRLTFLTEAGAAVSGGEASGSLGGSDSPGYRPITAGPIVRPVGAKYARVTVVAQAASVGASFSIDSVALTATPPAPTPTPTPTEEPVPAPPPEVEQEPPATSPIQSTPIATATPRTTATRTPTPTRSPTPTPTTIPLPAASLRNPDFSLGTAGWSVTGGRLSLGSHIEGHGQSLILTAEGTATAWVQQIVAATAGAWYSASAVLAPLDGVEAAWVRIAWYSAVDGSGAQMSTDDSPAVASASPTAITQSTYEVVATGPVRAPDGARSARVRILLRASSDRGASLSIDNVAFEPTEPLEASPHSPPALAPRASAPLPAAPVSPPRPEAATVSTPAARPPVAAPPAEATQAPAPAEGQQRRLRITEVMGNPDEAGPDGEYEWIEVMNTGTSPASLAGLSVRDRRSGVVLPPYLIDPGAVVVVAAPGARLPDGAPLVRLRHAIGNGLGNAGDRVALVGPDGREIDAVAYGEGSEEGEDAVPAPGPGQSIERRFSPAGILLEARLSQEPTPGQAPVARPADATAHTDATRPFGLAADLAPAWAILVALAGGLLVGAGAARAASIVRGRDLEA